MPQSSPLRPDLLGGFRCRQPVKPEPMTPIGETADSAKHRHQFRAARNQENEFTLIEPPVIRLSNFSDTLPRIVRLGTLGDRISPGNQPGGCCGWSANHHPTRRFGPASVRGG